ncbi:unnamed protein product [Rotaria sp. Silwood1]|nr:unnamed protein product [Rotaria sp. Silwood1]
MKEGKLNDILNVTKGGTCYRFLKCDRGPGNVSCLDWREVCDGKNDCFNNGIDEKGCFEVMELNECGPNEFRCRNGLCIPEDFLWEDSLDFDCLDGSDEIYGGQRFDTCYQDPAFRCEERTCRPYLNMVACGDGECVFTQIPTDFVHAHICMNARDILLSRALLAHEETPELSKLCWSTMICAMRIYNRIYSLFDTVRCETICGQPFTPKCDTLIEQNCPPLFQFPAHPVIHGHVVLIYTNERPEYTGGIRKPKYICYNRQFCPKLTLAQNSSSDSICVSAFLLNAPHMNYVSYSNFITFMTNLFHQCPPIDVVKRPDLCLNPNLFYCEYTLTCFSKHRLVDSVHDCLDPDDEEEPCSMNDTYRFHCTSESDKCISPFCIRDLHDDCMGGEDEIAGTNVRKNSRSYIPFQILCDGFTEFTINTDDTVIETDETNCDLWPCDNQYTRCNIYLNCPNGLDEAHCEWTACPPLHLPCVEPISKNITCLPLTLANDNITHCLGASDERHMCRIDGAESFPDTRYKCWNETGLHPCVSVDSLCDGEEDCEFGDDEQFCQNDDEDYFPEPCNDLSNGDRTTSHNFLCKLTDANKSRNIYFSLKNAITYPSTVPQLSKAMQKTEMVSKINVDNDRRQNISSSNFYRAWYCNRGIAIRYKHVGQICLCPPSYYGDRCEFQSQRVSVTLQMKASEYRTMIVLVLTLIDYNQQIHSYEQVHYIPFRDCKNKFNVVLLYNIRPKDFLRKYFVRIQAFEKSSFAHRATWLFPIKFPVLPVYRLVKQLVIPADETHTIAKNCPLKCLHGLCQRYINSEDFFCRCDSKWYGVLCDIPYVCQCSFDSRCVGIINNRSICVCPPHKFGPRCLLTRSSCPPSNCHHRGTCIFSDERISQERFVCLCEDGFSGVRCENIQTKIDISFAVDVSIPQALLGHFITVYNDSNPTQLSIYKKVPFNLETVTFHFSDPFHILLTEFDEKFYLAIVQETFTASLHIAVQLTASYRCLPIEEILDATILQFRRLHYVKYYHTLCRKNSDLVCFYDESLMCLCNQDRFANCFNFDRSITYSCSDTNYCTNKGRCFQNSETCQTPLLCVCNECYYGKRCQLSDPLHPEIEKVARGSFKKRKGYDDGIRGKGYVVNSLEAALWAFWKTKTFKEGAIEAVNLGDDTDTTAAIYGQLAGAFYGYTKLPPEWINMVYAKLFIECLCEWIAYEDRVDEPIDRNEIREKVLALLISMTVQLKCLLVEQFEWLLHVIQYASNELRTNVLSSVRYAEFCLPSCHYGYNKANHIGKYLVPFLSTHMPRLQTLRLW